MMDSHVTSIVSTLSASKWRCPISLSHQKRALIRALLTKVRKSLDGLRGIVNVSCSSILGDDGIEILHRIEI